MRLIVILWTFSTLLLSALVRILVLHIPLPVPNNFLIFLAGCVLGSMIEVNEMKEMTLIWELNPVVLVDIVVPVIMFQAAYFIHQETFRISFIQIGLLVFSNFAIMITLMGFLVTKFFDNGWNWNHAVMMSSIIVMPAPIITMGFLKRLAAPFKVQLFMELEALLGNIIVFIIFKCCILYNVIKGDSILPVHIVGIFVAPLLGILASKIVAYCLSKIIRDSVNEICIIVASVYLCYIVAQMYKMSGIFAVVSMGISMTGKRSFLGEGTEKFLIKFLHVISTYYNTNLVMITGIFFVTIFIPNVSRNDVFYIIIVFFILNMVRICVILMMSPLLLYTGHCLSWSNILVICVCNLKGSISILMSLCLMYEDFKINQAKKMFVQVTGQIVLSLLVNSVISNIVIRYDVFVNEDESKSQVIQRALDMLHNLRSSTIISCKHQNKFIADADWLEVEKFTMIQHPLFVTKFFKKSEKLQEVNFQKFEKIAIERILTMMKCSYVKQYDEGLLSRHAVKGVLQWSRQALAKGTSLIFPSMVASALKIPHHLQFMKRELWTKLRELMFLERHARKLGILLRTCVIFLHFIDVTVTVMHMADEIFVHSRTHRYAFFYYNLTFVSFNCGILILRYMIKRVMTLWETITFFIVPIGIVDVMALYILATEKPVFRFVRFSLAFSRLIRILQIGEVCPALIKLLLEVCEEHVCHHLSEGYDIGRSYIRGRQDVIRTLTNVELNFPEEILKKYLKTCTEHKIEAIRMMGYLQMRHPSVATSSKTKQAMRIVLKKMSKRLKHLQKERAVGHQDGSKLEKKILTRLSLVSGKLRLISPLTKDQIIYNVPWIKDNKEIYELIMEKGRLMHFKASDIIVTQLHATCGIYIILDGLVVVERLVKVGKKVEEEICDFLMSGNVIGEYTFLTKKPGHKTIMCETDVLAWHIRFEHLWKFIREMPGYKKDRLSSLEMRIWKVVAVKLAYRILLNEPDWFRVSRTQILTDLAEAKLVSLKGSNISLSSFVINSDVIVIQGKALDRGINEVFHGPFYIPRGQTNFHIADDSMMPILLVLNSDRESEDEDLLGPHFGEWKRAYIDPTDNLSDITLSSGTSHEKPSYKRLDRYLHCQNCSVKMSKSTVSIKSWTPGSETQL